MGVALLRDRGVTSGALCEPVCLTVLESGEVVGAIAFEKNTGSSVTAHMAGREGRLWMTKDILRFASNFAFAVLGVRRVYGPVGVRNRAALQVDRKMGFSLLTYLPDAFPNEDAFLLSLPRDEAVFFDPNGWLMCSAISPKGRQERLMFVPSLGALFHSSGRLMYGEENPIPLWNEKIDRRKSRVPSRLRIQLGLACNYSCSFCSQGPHIGRDQPLDLGAILGAVDRALLGHPEEIELWGGEPLVYWKSLRYLIPDLRERFPVSKISLVSNGALLDEDKAEFLARHKVSVCISHEGDAQVTLRGDDPFSRDGVIRACRLLNDAGLLEINSLFSEVETSPQGIVDAISSRLGFSAPVTSIDVPRVYNEGSALSDDTRKRILSNILKECAGPDVRVQFFEDKISTVRQSLTAHRISLVSCAGSDPDTLTVASDGAVILCQNTALDYTIGYLNRLGDAEAADPSYETNPKCPSCPALPSCLGSCLYLSGRQLEATCTNAFALHVGLVSLAVFRDTGYILTSFNTLEANHGEERLCCPS